MSIGVKDGDVRRLAGWLPEDQGDLEAWLAGHGERVAARGEDVVLHPAVAELQELIETDPVLRMYVERMVAEVPPGKPYTRQHLTDVPRCCA